MANVSREYNWVGRIDGGRRAGYRFFKILNDYMGNDFVTWIHASNKRDLDEAYEIASNEIFAPHKIPYNFNACDWKRSALVQLVKRNVKQVVANEAAAMKLMDEAISAGLMSPSDIAIANENIEKMAKTKSRKPKRGVGSY